MSDNIFVVDYPRKTEFAEAAVIPVKYNYDKIDRCPQCGINISGAYWEKPREIVLTKHRSPDFLYAYCDNVPFLLSEKALEQIYRAGLTGIVCSEKIEEVRFQRKSTKEFHIPTYYHIELARSNMTIDHQKSNIVYGSQRRAVCCSLCRQVPATYNFFRSLSFNMQAYEGYDIFQICELGETVLLSQKFVDFYEASTLTNLYFEPARKYGAQSASYFLDGNECD